MSVPADMPVWLERFRGGMNMFTHELLAGFNELELSIYNCIVKNKERIAHMKIKELADEAHVSTATVLRFCKKLGYEGYSEFKLRYREYLEKEKIKLEDTGETIFKGFISRMDSRDFQNSIGEAFDLLKDSRRIIFIGIGSSGILGKYGARYFSNIGRFSLYVEDPWLPILQDLTYDTVTIALSESGETEQTIYLASQMKERGSLMIAITNNSGSTLSRMSDYNITYHVPKVMVNRTNITTQVPVVYILEALAKKLYMFDNDKEPRKSDGFF